VNAGRCKTNHALKGDHTVTDESLITLKTLNECNGDFSPTDVVTPSINSRAMS